MDLYRLIEDFEDKGIKKEIDITSITEKLSEVTDGCMFFAVKGSKFDGNEHICDAIIKGARVIVTERTDILVDGDCVVITVNNVRKALAYASNEFYGRPADKLCMIGITGTNGKTTTAHMVHHILTENGIECGLIGTVGVMHGMNTESSSYTTPDAVTLFSTLSNMVKNGMTHVVMEVSSQALDQERVCGIHFKIGAFTNLSVDHLDYHLDMNSYAKTKLKLFDMAEMCVVNIDSDFSEPFKEYKRDGCVVYTFSAHADADFRAENVNLTANGNRFDVVRMSTFTAESVVQKICGFFNVYNSLAAYTISSLLGLSDHDISHALATFLPVKGRMEKVETDRGFTVIIDYAHTPDGLGNILSSIRMCCKGKILTVFGCGGDRDRSKRPLMGKIAAALSDEVIVTSDNPRNEDPEEIIKDIWVGMKKCNSAVKITDRKEAIIYALSKAKENDIVLLAGKGHETYQIIKGKKCHFDEREVIDEYLNGR